MLQLRVYARAQQVVSVAASLIAARGVRHVVRAGKSPDESVELVSADVEVGSADLVLERLEGLGLDPSEITLERQTSVAPVGASRGGWVSAGDALLWTELVGSAQVNARIVGRFLGYMAIAGVIAGFGVMNRSPILIVGAMAISPDMLPMAAFCVGVVARRAILAGRALASLLAGLACTWAVAAVMALTMRAIDYPPLRPALGDGGLGVLPTVNASTFLVAFAAGVAGMWAFETRAGAAVGVAISITTIPAAAYAGVALAVGEFGPALGALEVLAINVAMVLSAGTLTVLVQRRSGSS
jgi:uncharacterized hydrophobic protein (TIGR00271 family)